MTSSRHLLLAAATLAFLSGCGGSDETISCGNGTRLDGDSCVAEGGDLTSPRVERVVLTGLSVEEEGQRAAFVGFPMNVALTLDLVGEAIRTEVVVGLESADSAVTCVVGAIPIESGRRPEGSSPVKLSAELIVQPECAALQGQTGVRTWVSFDPFEKTRVVGRAPIPIPQQLSPEFFRPSRLDQAACKGPVTHADTCATNLEVKPSPGLDLTLRQLSLDSSVAVVHTRFKPDYSFDPEAPENNNETPGALPPFDPEQGLPTIPQFRASTELLLHGSDAAGGLTLGGDQVSLTFALRPDPSRTPADFPEQLLEWMPLSVEKQTLAEGSKGGEPSITMERLQEQFLRSLSSATRLHKESPVFIDGAARERVLQLQDQVRHYELKVCAVPRFTEASWEQDPSANNCVTMPVVVLHQQLQTPQETGTTIPGAATSSLYEQEYEASTGSKDSIKMSGKVYVETGCTTGLCKAKAGTSMNLSGEWIDKIDGGGNGNFTLLDFYVYGQGAVVAQHPTMAAGRLKIAGLTLWNPTLDLSQGKTFELPPIEVSVEYPLLGGSGCISTLCADLSVAIEPTLSLNTSFTYKEIVAKPNCTGGRTTPSGRCFVAENTPFPWSMAENYCRLKGGHLAETLSSEENEAARLAMIDKGFDGAWLGAQRTQEDCSILETLAKSCKFNCSTIETQLQTCKIMNSTRTVDWVGNGMTNAGPFTRWKAPFTGGPKALAAGLLIDKNGEWSELNPSLLRGFVCEYPKEFDLSVTITPGFSLPLVIEASGYVKGYEWASVGAYGSVSALNIDFVNTFGLRWSFESLGLDAQKPDSLGNLKLRTMLYYNAGLELSGLNGEIGLSVLGQNFPIFQWDGIEYASYDLWNVQRTRMISF
jgi:hypothetical protein